jgi:hypothetical protein
VLLAFVPKLVEIYSQDGDALSSVPLRGFVHCLDVAADAECSHHELRARPKERENPGLLRMGAAVSAPSVLQPGRFVAVDEDVLGEVLYDLLEARGGAAARGACARRRLYCSWPTVETVEKDAVEKDAVEKDAVEKDAVEKDVLAVGVDELLLETALREAHADDAEDGEEGGGGAMRKAERIELLSRTLRDVLMQALLKQALQQPQTQAKEQLVVGNPLAVAQGFFTLPNGWSEVREDNDVWYEHVDGRSQWEKPRDATRTRRADGAGGALQR